MAFLHVITGQQRGASIQLDNDKSYTVSSNLTASDIFIAANTDYSFNVSVNDLGVTFKSIHGKILDASNNNLVQDGKLYFFESKIKFSEVVIAFSLEAKNYFTQNKTENELSDVDVDISEDEIEDQAAEKTNLNITTKIVVVFGVTLRFLFNLLLRLKDKLGKAFYPSMSLFLIMLIAIGTTFYLLSVERHQESLEYRKIAIADSRKKVEKTLLNLTQDNYRGITVGYENNDVVIKGILPDIDSFNSLKKILNKIKNIHLKYKVKLFSQIETTALHSCEINGIINAKVTMDQNWGLTIFVSGIAKSGDDINNLEIDLHNQFPDLEQIDTSRVFVASDIENYWSNLATQMKQQFSPDYAFNRGIVYLNGVLSQENLIVLNSAVNDFNQKYLNVVKAIPNVTDVVNTLSFGVKEVFIGDSTSWIVTNDGHVLFVGGSYKGVTLLKINPEVLTFRTNFDFSVPIDELINSINRESGIKGKINDTN